MECVYFPFIVASLLVFVLTHNPNAWPDIRFNCVLHCISICGPWNTFCCAFQYFVWKGKTCL